MLLLLLLLLPLLPPPDGWCGAPAATAPTQAVTAALSRLQ